MMGSDSSSSTSSSEEEEQEKGEYNPVISLDSMPMQIDVSIIKNHYVEEGKSCEDCSGEYRMKVDYRTKTDVDESDTFTFHEQDAAHDVYEEIREAREDWENKVSERRKEMLDKTKSGEDGLGFG